MRHWARVWKRRQSGAVSDQGYKPSPLNFWQPPGRGKMMAERKEEEQRFLWEIKGALIKGFSRFFLWQGQRSALRGASVKTQWQWQLETDAVEEILNIQTHLVVITIYHLFSLHSFIIVKPNKEWCVLHRFWTWMASVKELSVCIILLLSVKNPSLSNNSAPCILPLKAKCIYYFWGK